jgi:hypothetical protein
MSVSLSVRPHGGTRHPLDGFSWKLERFLKIFEKIGVLLKYDKNNGYFYMKTDVHLWQYLIEFFTEREMSQTKVVENIRAHYLFSTFQVFLIDFLKCPVFSTMQSRAWSRYHSVNESGNPCIVLLEAATNLCVVRGGSECCFHVGGLSRAKFCSLFKQKTLTFA